MAHQTILPSHLVITWFLALVLVAVSIAWKLDHDHLASSRQKMADRKQVDQLLATITQLHQQQMESDAALAQLRTVRPVKAAESAKQPPESKTAEQKLTEMERDYATIQAQFNDLRARNDQVMLDESRYFQLYTTWKESCLDQKEYTKGLYVDDLSLRTEAKQKPYPPLAPVHHNDGAATAASVLREAMAE